MLTTQERTGVITEMGAQLLQAGLGAGALVFQWMERHGPRAKSHASFDIWARNVLRYCERYGWIEDPALLLVLLRKVAAAPRTPFDAQIPTVVARIAAQQPIVFWTKGRAWDTCHLALELPSIRR